MARFVSFHLSILLGTLVLGCLPPTQPSSPPLVDSVHIASATKFILPGRITIFTVDEKGYSRYENLHEVWSVSDSSVQIQTIQLGSMKCTFLRNGQYRIHLNAFDTLTHELLTTADTTIRVGFQNLAIVTNPAHPQVGDSILFSVSGKDMSSFRFEWDLGDSIYQATTQSKIAGRSFDEAGDHPISVRIYDSIGLVDSISESLHVTPIGGEFTMAKLRQFSKVEISMSAAIGGFGTTSLTWNLDSASYSSGSYTVDSSWGVHTVSENSSINIIVSEAGQSLWVGADTTASNHSYYNHNYDYVDFKSSLSCSELKAAIVSSDSVCFIANGVSVLNSLKYIYAWSHQQRTQMEQSYYEDEKTILRNGIIPTVQVIFRK